MKKVILAKSAGFCFGVNRAIEIVNKLVDEKKSVCTLGPIIHNMQVVDELKRFFPKKVYSTPIPRNVKLSEAPSYGQPVMYYDKRSTGAAAYGSLADEFLSKN